MEEIKVIVEKFEDFIKRSVLPSASFMLFFLLYDTLINKAKVIEFLDKPEHGNLTIGLFVLAFIGLTNLLSTLQQIIYDNRLKGNFNASLIWTEENKKLDELRGKVNTKLGKNENDYMLYKKIARDEKKREYVNQAKSFGIMFVSLMIISSILFISSIITLVEEPSLSSVAISFFILIAMAIEYFWGRELVKSRYRSRAIKIYTNFLETDFTYK